MKVNPAKSVHVTFAIHLGSFPPVCNHKTPIPANDTVKYLGITVDRQLTWAPYIKTKKLALPLRNKSLYSLLGKRRHKLKSALHCIYVSSLSSFTSEIKCPYLY